MLFCNTEKLLSCGAVDYGTLFCRYNHLFCLRNGEISDPDIFISFEPNICKQVVMRILVVEDEPNILLLYKRLLQDKGHDVTATTDGEECLQQYLLSVQEKKYSML